MAYKQYTFCVSRDDFDAFDWASFIGPALVLLGGIVAAFALGPPAVFVAFIGALWALNKVCTFLLGGKLICLGGDRCAIGRVVELEPVGHGKSGFERIDNDFSVNLLLAPHRPNAKVADIEGDGAQGELIAQKRPELDGLEFRGYSTHAGSLTIPVLHTEFEGSRIHDFCEAVPWALAALSIGTAICLIPVFGWIACLIALAVGGAIAAAIIIDAWAGAEGGSPSDAEVGPGHGELSAMNKDTLDGGDYVIITGRWCWDGGHVHESGEQGWNELHPAKSVQKIPRTWDEGSDPATVGAFDARFDNWCRFVRQAADPAVIAAQAKPEHEWVMHPVLDGCRPEEEQEEEEGEGEGGVEPPH